MTGLVPFHFEGAELRSYLVDGEPWFVSADALALCDLNRSSLALLDDDEKGVHTVDTLGGPQQMGVISEAGLYSLILRSRKAEAKAIKRWITHEVLPQIRRTGSYGTVAAIPSHSEALRGWAAEVEAREFAEAKVAELEGPAASWEHFASTDGDLSVNEAAKVLSRDPLISIGEHKLWRWLDDHGWTYRDSAGDRRAYQTRIDSGHLTARARGHHNPRDGVWVVDAPQVRVPMRGLELLRKHLARPLQVVAS